MTETIGGRRGAALCAAIGLLILCALPAGAQTETMRFGITLECEKPVAGIPVHASLIPIKPPDELQYPRDSKGDYRHVFAVYNLDIWGGTGAKRVSVGSSGFAPTVTVWITWMEDGKPRYPHISYYVPALGTWVSHAEVASGRVPVADMQVSPIDFDAKEGRFRFTITRWPLDDRMMCHGD
jgi:hypothetical protein